MEQQVVTLTITEFRVLIKEVVQEVMRETDRPELRQLEDFLNARQAANLLGMAMQTLYEKTSQKILPYYKYGNKIMFKRSELVQWMEKGKVSTLADLEREAYNSSRKGKEERASRKRNALY